MSTSEAAGQRPSAAGHAPRIGIVVVAYNAANTLAAVLDRIPVSFRPQISETFVCDDHSQDSTYLVGLGYKQLATDLPLTIIRQPHNLGYGGNQKVGYRLAIQHGLDIVVLLHGDGQYAPECLPDIVAPLVRGECDAVFGSRMMLPGAARKGGMPLYKYVGNRILTRFENAMLGTDLSEFHSGYRAYSVAALKRMPFEENSNGFDFDTEIIIQLVDHGMRIAEVPIPTYYGDEICYVNGMKYARDVSLDVLRYRIHRLGLGRGTGALDTTGYEFKDDPESSHLVLLDWLSHLSPRRVLDLGCSAGYIGAEVRKFGHEVVGVDVVELPGVHERLDRFVRADLDRGIPDEVDGRFDVVLAADVLEHVREPGELLRSAVDRLAPGGVVLTSVPNFAHWYPRARTLSGLFDYDQRGILDRGHLRFFTRRSFQRLVADVGLTVGRVQAVGVPLEHVLHRHGPVVRAGRTVERGGLRLWPTLFAYQFVYELHAAR